MYSDYTHLKRHTTHFLIFLSSSDFNHHESPHIFPSNVLPALSFSLSYSHNCSPLSWLQFCPPSCLHTPHLPPVLVVSAWPSLSRWKTCLTAQWQLSLGDLRRQRLVSKPAVKKNHNYLCLYLTVDTITIPYHCVTNLIRNGKVNSGKRDACWAEGHKYWL